MYDEFIVIPVGVEYLKLAFNNLTDVPKSK